MSKIWVDISYNHHQMIVYRLDNGVIGKLRGNGLRIAERIAEQMVDNSGCSNGAPNYTGIYNEIEIDSRDFVPY